MLRRPVPTAARLLKHAARTHSMQQWRDRALLGGATASGASVHPVPSILAPPSYRYVDYSGPWIEDHFLRHYLSRNLRTPLVYLPILWASVYQHIQVMNFLPRQGDEAMAAIERILRNELRPDVRYFTVLDYDHAIWDWHLFPKNVLVFSAGGSGDVPIPWLKGSPPLSNPPKDLRVSFMGRLDGASNAGDVRGRMREALEGVAHFGFGPDWRDVMARSTFSLCPRGLGRATYRLYEALSVNSIPIYLWDDLEWLPYRDHLDWDAFAISLSVDRAHELPATLAAWDDARIARARAAIADCYESHFTLDGVCGQILRMVDEFADKDRFDATVARRRPA